jgi:hypothetical protein
MKKKKQLFCEVKTVKLKKLSVMALCVFLLTLAFAGVVNAAPEETQDVYYLEYGGLKIDIKAPVKAYAGDNITVTVKTETVVSQIYIKYINIDIYGVMNDTNKIYLDQITHLTNSSLSSYEAQYNVAIPADISPGLTYGIISCEWELMGSPQKIPPSGFALTYIQNIELEQLQAKYEELNATYQSSLQNYTKLESGLEGELGSTRNLLYIFVATTVVASITVIVLLMRKPKRVWT